MVAIAALTSEQSLKVRSGQREMTLKPKDLEHYLGDRARRGMALPRGWRSVERLTAV
jgi:topoisomerase-4 subunit A